MHRILPCGINSLFGLVSSPSSFSLLFQLSAELFGMTWLHSAWQGNKFTPDFALVVFLYSSTLPSSMALQYSREVYMSCLCFLQFYLFFSPLKYDFCLYQLTEKVNKKWTSNLQSQWFIFTVPSGWFPIEFDHFCLEIFLSLGFLSTVFSWFPFYHSDVFFLVFFWCLDLNWSLKNSFSLRLLY